MENEKKQKERKARKSRFGKKVPIEMPDEEVMKEVKREIQEITEKEKAYLKKKEQVVLNLFILAIFTSFVCLSLFFWTLVHYPAFAKDYYEFRTVLVIAGSGALWVILLIFDLYAEKNNWRSRRKKNIITWMMILFLAFSLIIILTKL